MAVGTDRERRQAHRRNKQYRNHRFQAKLHERSDQYRFRVATNCLHVQCGTDSEKPEGQRCTSDDFQNVARQPRETDTAEAKNPADNTTHDQGVTKR